MKRKENGDEEIDGSLSYIISIVEANGNRYLFCERF